MSIPRLPVSLLLSLILLGVGAHAWAGPPSRRAPPVDLPPRSDRQHNDEALSDSVRWVERSTRGQVLSAERVPYDGRSINRIKIVDDRGRVRVYMDDPQSRPPQPESPKPPPTRDDDD